MNLDEQKRFDLLYAQHQRLLKLHGYALATIDGYSRAVRRVAEHFDCVPDQLCTEQLQGYFEDLVSSHSWSTVKIDRNGLRFFWEHVLKLDWTWLKIIKAPKVQSLPDVLSPKEVADLVTAARKLRYRVFILTTYSMGLRLSETLALEVGDIDAERHRVHIRRGKGHKDRFVPLPDRTYAALRQLWLKHQHPRLLFPNASGGPERIAQATTPMNRGGTQRAMKILVAQCGIKKRFPSIPCATALPPICLRAD